ncbi:MAG: deoxyribodipyrimidine photo-lyase/cryptochrome family protein [Runella sp.]
MLQIVWLKKDLRLRDHAPLKSAIELSYPTLLIYIFEPTLINASDSSSRHWQFVYHSLLSMNTELKPLGAEVRIFYGEAIDVFDWLVTNHAIKGVFSYQETGNDISFKRDRILKTYFKDKGIKWVEFQSNGVIRGLQNRAYWGENWEKSMNEPEDTPILEKLIPSNIIVPEYFCIDPLFKRKMENYPKAFQPPGEKFAWRYLTSFFEERANGYTKYLSKPLDSRFHCSRMSPYLTWGNLSSKQLFKFYQKNVEASLFKRDLINFRSRLQWRCHFIQKFESECRMEFEPLNKTYIQLQKPVNEDFIQAWEDAKTGYPLVDACMKAVKETGYLNFRMRAMLVSFLTHTLWQPWPLGVHFLARQFLDYEIGIHFSQWQMQAGLWGINTIRVYNPVKQSIENDFEGQFIKIWLPELKKIPNEYIHEPYKMTPLEQKFYDIKIGVDYPYPIVNYEIANKRSLEILHQFRKREDTKIENERIIGIHVSRKKNS